jgi:4-hydroxythreonine-4-phosphate dehydrogenase
MSKVRVRSRVTVGISLGDPSGIGPEVLASALAHPQVRRSVLPVVFGDEGIRRRFPIFSAMRRGDPDALLSIDEPTFCSVTALPAKDRVPGKPTRATGHAQYEYIESAISAAKAGHIEAICTAPVSKEQITRAGITFMGHTEVLADAFGAEVLMLMDGPRLRVALATNHLPLAKVSRALTADRLARQLELLSRELAPSLGKKPRIAVLGFNPHAGEGGLLGDEEVRAIAPAVTRARAAGVRCEGPLPADGLFASHAEGYDAVLAMFHDQGLIPAKALDFERTVNVTLGLPVPRTSPDHGVAYAIAGKGRASSVPMRVALLRAAELVRARR